MRRNSDCNGDMVPDVCAPLDRDCKLNGVPGGGGAVSVDYDAAGNLSRNEADFEFLYDYDNRLTSVTYEGGAGSTQVAHFAYDALGRMISSQLRFDADVDGKNETLKYYYDGQNTIAEYDESDNLSRRYVHGTTYVDERAMLIEGDGADDTLDTYYYILQDLHTVTGLIKKNGTLAEAYTYDAYGDVEIWGYRDFDANRNGDVYYDISSSPDRDAFWAVYTEAPTSDPIEDSDMAGGFCQGRFH